jgi:SagB-type dehydrogenase family enzyme
VNPSSGNLHPTEAYVVCGPLEGIASGAGVYHYAADRHALEQRCAFDSDAWQRSAGADIVLLVLTSIHWREAWKYGERAFRYCQHDLGHAVAAIAAAAALSARRTTMIPDWSHRAIASLVGIDREADYVDAEREEPGCLLALIAGDHHAIVETAGDEANVLRDREALVRAVGDGRWTGRANQLSEDHVQWTFIDDIAAATRDPGRTVGRRSASDWSAGEAVGSHGAATAIAKIFDRGVMLKRRSALALDARSSIEREQFVAMLASVMPETSPPWDALWWDPRIHLALFVHRVEDVDPGLYVLVRSPRAIAPLRAAMHREFTWVPAGGDLPLFQLAIGDARAVSQRLSCDQEIAADGFFSLGMIAEFDGSVAQFGPAFYRHLFWESGVVGQVLYLAAEAAGVRGTGIGCFYDDPVHQVLGLADHAFQSLYHFTIGVPVDDPRLTTEPGYRWEMGTDPETKREPASQVDCGVRHEETRGPTRGQT